MSKLLWRLLLPVAWLVVTGFLLFVLPPVPYPHLNTATTGLQFDGNRAYQDLATLVKHYPNRMIGTETNRAAAAWIAENFRKIGLDVSEHYFTATGANDENIGQPLSFFDLKPAELTKTHRGVNIIGTSPGQEPAAVIIAAHRDLYGSQQGAEDDGSGTVSLLELARVLTAQPHRYTYVFISFDGEELGLLGSEKFVKEKKLSYPVVCAISLDMVGWKDADTIGAYKFGTRRDFSPIWTYVLMQQIMQELNLPANLSPESYYAPREIVPQYFNRIAGIVQTDTEPFVDQGLPILGIGAANSAPEFIPREIHQPGDVIEKVSPATLQMTGRFTEAFVKSLTINDFSKLSSKNYFTLLDGYLPAWRIYLPALLFIGIILLQSLGNLYQLSELGINYPSAWWEDRKIFFALLIGSFVLAGYPWLSLVPFISNNVPVFVLGITGIALTLAFVIFMLIYRARVKTALGRQEAIAVRRMIYCDLLFTLALISWAMDGMYFMVFTMFIPVFILNILPFGHGWRRWLAILAVVLWGVFLFPRSLFALIAGSIFSPLDIRLYFSLVYLLFLFFSSLTYLLRNPVLKEQ